MFSPYRFCRRPLSTCTLVRSMLLLVIFIWIYATVPQLKRSIKIPVFTEHTSSMLSHHNYVLVANFLTQFQQLCNNCITSWMVLAPCKLICKRVPRKCRLTVSKLLHRSSHSKSRARQVYFYAWISLLSILTSKVTQSWHLKIRRLSRARTATSCALPLQSRNPQHRLTGQAQTPVSLPQPPQYPLPAVIAHAPHHANITGTLPTLASRLSSHDPSNEQPLTAFLNSTTIEFVPLWSAATFRYSHHPLKNDLAVAVGPALSLLLGH